jgi:hypothetical protein
MVKTEVEIVVNTTDATKSIDEVGGAVENAAGNFENLSVGAEGARAVLDEATGGLASRVKNVATGIAAMGKSATKAFKAAIAGASGMKKALIATGIGAIVVAVSALVAYWEDFVGWLGFGAEETKKLTEAQEAYNNALASASASAQTTEVSLKTYLGVVQDVTAAEEDRLAALQKLKEAGIATEDVDLANAESLGLLNKRVEENIRLSFARAKASAASKQLEEEYARMYKLGGAIEESRAASEKEIETLIEMGFYTEELAQSQRELQAGAEEMARSQIQEDINRAQKEYQEALEALIPLEGQNIEQQEEVREKLERRAKTDAAVAQALKDRQAAEEKAAAAYEEVLRQARKTQEDEEIALMESMALALDTLYQGQLTAKEQELNAIADKYYQLEQYYVDDAETAKYIEEQKQKDLQAIQDKYRNEEEQGDKALAQTKLELIKQGIGAANDLAQAALSGNEKRAKAAFRINKALSLSQAIINTAQAVSAALAQTTDPSPTQSFRFANAAIAGAQGLAQILTISKQQFNPSGGAGGGGGAASVPRPSASRPTLRFDTQGINSSIGLDQSPDLGNQIAESLTGNPIKAYVVSQEVQTQAKMNRKIRETATIG